MSRYLFIPTFMVLMAMYLIVQIEKQHVAFLEERIVALSARLDEEQGAVEAIQVWIRTPTE